MAISGVNSTVSTVEKLIEYPCHAEIIKVAVLGDLKVGKSAFIKAFIFGVYDPYLQSSLNLDFMTRDIKIDNDTVVVQLWETQPASFNCAIILYDITSRQSFGNATMKLEGLRRDYSDDFPILLLANKIDTEKKRQVMMYEGELVALKHNTMFNEISCTEASNIKQSVTGFFTSMMTVETSSLHEY